MKAGVPRTVKSPLHFAAKCGYIETTQLLLRAGADVHVKNSNNDNVLECAVKMHHRRLYPMLLAAGARMASPPPAIIYPQEGDDPYLEDVHAVGFPAYEKAHRQVLVALAAKCFPCLPKEVAAQVAGFAFHVGCYSPPRSTFWRDFHARATGPL